MLEYHQNSICSDHENVVIGTMDGGLIFSSYLKTTKLPQYIGPDFIKGSLPERFKELADKNENEMVSL